MTHEHQHAEPAVVCIGASWGGVEALRQVLGDLPGDLGAAICIVLHRAEHDERERLARVLSRESHVRVVEPDDKQPLHAGTAYVAPAGYHLLVDEGHVSLSADDKVNWARPSIDVLFESVAESRGDESIAVVLTGANDDGARGARAVHDAGGTVLVQDPDEAERREMPDATIAMTEVDAVLPLSDLAQAIVRHVRGVVAE
jgi:two-component system chemotaxis response regulator CheB